MKRTDDSNIEDPSVPESFSLLPVPMPPMLPSLTGHNGISRYFCLYYLGSKANWINSPAMFHIYLRDILICAEDRLPRW